MPLPYDDIPGSWGVYSKNWPFLTFSCEDAADRAFIACTKAKVVPYGSYVKYDDVIIRLETEELKNKLAVWLVECSYESYDELRDHFIDTGQWNN